MSKHLLYVNTEQPPLVTIHHGKWRHVHQGIENKSIVVEEWVTEKYPHPDAPEDGFVSLDRWLVIGKFPTHSAEHGLLDVLEHVEQGIAVLMIRE